MNLLFLLELMTVNAHIEVPPQTPIQNRYPQRPSRDLNGSRYAVPYSSETRTSRAVPERRIDLSPSLTIVVDFPKPLGDSRNAVKRATAPDELFSLTPIYFLIYASGYNGWYTSSRQNLPF